MTTNTSAFTRDANRVPITTLGLTATKAITYATATTGAIGATTLFTVTGDVALNVFGICKTSLTGASATIEFGTATSTAALGNQVTGTNVDVHMVYHDAVLAVGGAVAGHMHVVDEDIIQTIGTAAVETGAITWYCTWVPLSADGNVVAA
jgi:hypothetical protein